MQIVKALNFSATNSYKGDFCFEQLKAKLFVIAIYKTLLVNAAIHCRNGFALGRLVRSVFDAD